MKEHGVWKFVFSSSATVYGLPQKLPINEDHPVGLGMTNPYGKSKFFIEEIIKDLCKAEKVLEHCFLVLETLQYSDFLLTSVIPENSSSPPPPPPPSPRNGLEILVGWGLKGQENLKKSMKLNWNLQRGIGFLG